MSAPRGSTEALDLVFGRRDTPAEADELLDRVRGVGYVERVARGRLRRWKVLYDGIERYERGSSHVRRRAAQASTPSSSVEPPG